MNKEKKFRSEEHSTLNKKSIILIISLIVIGIITGFLVSNYFIIDANQDIKEWNKAIDEWQEKWDNSSWWNTSWWNTSNGNDSFDNSTWGNTSYENNTGTTTDSWQNNSNWSSFYQELKPINYQDVILPIITVILLCINSYFLLSLNLVYAKIYKNTKSKYILGLLFVLIPLLGVSLFFIRIVKTLFFSSALSFNFLSSILGFGINGIGGMFSVISVLMILGFAILLYLSNE